MFDLPKYRVGSDPTEFFQEYECYFNYHYGSNGDSNKIVRAMCNTLSVTLPSEIYAEIKGWESYQKGDWSSLKQEALILLRPYCPPEIKLNFFDLFTTINPSNKREWMQLIEQIPGSYEDLMGNGYLTWYGIYCCFDKFPTELMKVVDIYHPYVARYLTNPLSPDLIGRFDPSREYLKIIETMYRYLLGDSNMDDMSLFDVDDNAITTAFDECKCWTGSTLMNPIPYDPTSDLLKSNQSSYGGIGTKWNWQNDGRSMDDLISGLEAL